MYTYLMDSTTGFILLIVLIVCFGLPVLLLYLKDAFLRREGVNKSETTRLSIIWLVSPFMLILSLVLIAAGWYVANDTKNILGFLISLGVGSILGLIDLYRKVFLYSNYQLVKTRKKAITIFIVVIILSIFLKVSHLGDYISPISDYIPGLYAIFLGVLATFLMLSTIANFINAIRRKPTTLF